MIQKFISASDFKFSISRLPKTSFYVQEMNLPGISLGKIYIPNANKKFPIHGDEVEYDQLTLTIAADEKLASFKEIFNWIIALGRPKTFEGYQEFKDETGLYSDATITLLDNSKNPSISLSFRDIFPISLGEINFNLKNTDTPVTTFPVTFAYTSYEFV